MGSGNLLEKRFSGRTINEEVRKTRVLKMRAGKVYILHATCSRLECVLRASESSADQDWRLLAHSICSYERRATFELVLHSCKTQKGEPFLSGANAIF
jgi:hypothetical protein